MEDSQVRFGELVLSKSYVTGLSHDTHVMAMSNQTVKYIRFRVTYVLSIAYFVEQRAREWRGWFKPLDNVNTL